jgi:hypothetical protein
MKRNHFFAGSSIFAILLLVTIASCSKDDNTTPPPADEIYTINATMNGANEKPNATTSTGTGTTTGTYNKTTHTLQYNVSWTGLTGTASAGHFHGAAAATATANPVIYFNLVNSGSAGTASGSAVLTTQQESDLLAGLWYSNIHTAANSGGEIRGQVAATK